MKHFLPLFAILFFLPLSASAQKVLSIAPNPVEKVFVENLSDLDLTLELTTLIKNLTKDTLRLRWQRDEMIKPGSWQTQVCDPNFCYLPNVSTNFNPNLNFNEPVILLPDSTIKLTLYILPNGKSGTTAVDIDLSLLREPDKIIETVMYRAEVRSQTTSVSQAKINQVRLFPNPAADYFELGQNLEGVDQVVLYNLLGRPVRQFQANRSSRFSLEGLADGIYLVSLVSRREGVLRTLRLSKRSLRP